MVLQITALALRAYPGGPIQARAALDWRPLRAGRGQRGNSIQATAAICAGVSAITVRSELVAGFYSCRRYADSEYLKKAKGFSSIPKAELQQHIIFDGDIVVRLLKPAIMAANQLLIAVDDWLAKPAN